LEINMQCRHCPAVFDPKVPFGHNAHCAGLSPELRDVAASVTSGDVKDAKDGKIAFFQLLDEVVAR
jgi:hypothetical protein